LTQQIKLFKFQINGGANKGKKRLPMIRKQLTMDSLSGLSFRKNSMMKSFRGESNSPNRKGSDAYKQVIQGLAQKTSIVNLDLNGMSPRKSSMRRDIGFDLEAIAEHKGPARRSINFTDLLPVHMGLTKGSRKGINELDNTKSFRRTSTKKFSIRSEGSNASPTKTMSNTTDDVSPRVLHTDCNVAKVSSSKPNLTHGVIKLKIDNIRRLSKFPVNNYNTEINLLIAKDQNFDGKYHHWKAMSSINQYKAKVPKCQVSKEIKKVMHSEIIMTNETRGASFKCLPVKSDMSLYKFDKKYGILSTLAGKKKIRCKE
jgi:hypothetical protein